MSGRRIVAAVAAAILTMLFPTFATAGHGPVSPGGPYSGYTTSSIVHVDAITTSSVRAANVEVGVVNAAVNSAGLQPVVSDHQRTVVPAESTAFHSRAVGSIAEAGVILSPPTAANQLAPFRAESNSPNGEGDVSASLLTQAVGPVVFADIANRSASTRWNNTCVIGEPIAAGSQHLARVEVLETGDDPATPANEGFDKPVVGVDSKQAGPHRTTSFIRAVEQLFWNGKTIGLQSITATTLAPVTLLQGTANEFTIEVDGPSYLSAMADGLAGGAKIGFTVPLVTVIQNGIADQVLPGEPLTIRVPATGDAIAEVRVGVIDNLAAPKGLGDKQVLGNGTRAAAAAHVVEVKLLDLASQGLRGATVALGHMEVASNVPAGGIKCTLPVTKAANPKLVRVGNLFDTTITVSNPFKCTLSNVTLGDVIGVEKASLFSIVKSKPAASASAAGTNLSAGSAKWGLGSIPAGGAKSVVLTLRALGGAGTILDTATATGTLTGCFAKPAGSAADVTGLARVNVPASGIGTLRVPETGTSVLGKKLVPTGIEDVAAVAGGLAFLLFALIGGLSLRRRV